MQPSLRELFRGFLEVALSGFGGVLAWAHRTLVERRRWLTEREFAELLGLSQALPGGNIINMAIFVGLRFGGWRGVLATMSGLMIVPLCLLLTINALSTGTEIASLSTPALRGAAPVVAGLTLVTGVKMLRGQHWTLTSVGITVMALVAIVVLQLALVPVLIVLAPLSLALAWRRNLSSS